MPATNWERNILGMIPETEWIDVGFNVTRQNDPIDGLFGDLKTDNLVAEWEDIAAEYQIPMMAQFHAFDTESQKTFRIPIDTHNIEKGLIKVKINQSERLRALTGRGVRDDALYDYVLNDGIRLAEQVFTRSKVAKNELMATGQVTIKENDLNLTVDYGVPSSHKNLTFDVGDGATEDLASQIQDIIDSAEAVGITITGMMTSKRNLTKMRKNAGLQKLINGNIAEGQMVRQTAFDAFLDEEFGITQVITNDLTYGKSATIGADGRPQVSSARYFPTDKVTFFAANPGGKLGTGLWGNPPEADDFEIKVGASGVSPYVWVSQWFEKDPHVLWTKASALFMPVLYNPDSLWIADVTETDA